MRISDWSSDVCSSDLTANIGIHHVHHLASRIPYYRLPRVLRDHPELAGTSRLTFLQSLGCIRLALWDESQKRLVSFREAQRQDRQLGRASCRERVCQYV